MLPAWLPWRGRGGRSCTCCRTWRTGGSATSARPTSTTGIPVRAPSSVG